MFTIIRRIRTIEPNIRVCTQLFNAQINSFSTQYKAPHAVKRKKAKAKDVTVSDLQEHFYYEIFRITYFFIEKINFFLD